MSNRLVASATLIAVASVLWAPGVASAGGRDTAFVQTAYRGAVAASTQAARLETVPGGTGHHGGEAAVTGAGGGGQFAARRNGLNAVGAAGLAGGILVTAVVTVRLARRRPTGSR
ncbi:hypothetical protein GCM10010347_26420 [Streptomyces cirratus]|uniref:Integral membrane protein n=1 Tax=Streptomyces cirratus TaxID=68187 RepID=A0ABQ3ETM8_9ACTN|nr:hypothetical protein [Streptomyces cirratus]GHB55205.1 hypothetical protein GCM10010347_26420 [Streptomyces cirratus]